jgi:dTDP-4-amino-4,6-dideoxygalactose transaminase
VITAANSFIATPEAITMTGARVVFADCDPSTYTIDIEGVRRAITKRTKAVIPVHLYGLPANMPALASLAEEHGLKIVEDCAQAHGAAIDQQPVGTLGHIGCFSFYPGKNLGAYGDAGAIITNNDEIATKCRMIANHGRIGKYDHQIEGVNSRLDGLQAAILCVKLRHLEDWTEKRRAAAKRYISMLGNTGVELPVVPEGYRHVFHLFVVRVKERKKAMDCLTNAGISTGIHYPIALPHLLAYRYLEIKSDAYPVATNYSGEILSLPVYPELTESQIAFVVENLRAALK